MDVRAIRHAAEWNEFAPAWRRIAESSPAATIFQTWEWTSTWWEFFGGRRRLWMLVFLENNAPIGFAPLFFPVVPALGRVARLIGTGGSDYLDFLAAPGREADVLRAFWEFAGAQRDAWDWIDLQQIRPGAVAASDTPPARGVLRGEIWPGETCPFLPLPGDWETFRKGLGKKLRSNLGYYERALGKQFEVEMRLATPETLANDMDAFFELHQRRWNRRWLPGAFAARRARTFHETVAARLLKAGYLRLHTLLLDGEIQAALYCFQFGKRCAYYLGGFEPTLARLSIGTVLTAHAIRHAIEADGATEFDFLRGDEPYKYRWGARDRANRRLSLTQTRPLSRLRAQLGRQSLRAEMALKTWMHRKHGSHGTDGRTRSPDGAKGE